ncbi:MAG: hypothetical protein MI924_14000 [Chloroflexales bacterium]|nr:hypothetical protein [Chloroflexales bacterium]
MIQNTKMKIDIQHHTIPQVYIDRLASIGITESLSVPFPKWSPEASLRFMKKVGIEVAVMSISTPGVCFRDEEFSRDLARRCNEVMAETKRLHPGRFASIPRPP